MELDLGRFLDKKVSVTCYRHKDRGDSCVFLLLSTSLEVGRSLKGPNYLEPWFPKCALRIPRDPRPVPWGSVDTFL